MGAILFYKQDKAEFIELYYDPERSRDAIASPEMIDTSGDLYEVRAYFLLPPGIEIASTAIGDYRKQYTEAKTPKPNQAL